MKISWEGRVAEPGTTLVQVHVTFTDARIFQDDVTQSSFKFRWPGAGKQECIFLQIALSVEVGWHLTSVRPSDLNKDLEPETQDSFTVTFG